jgi:hypothetical protein
MLEKRYGAHVFRLTSSGIVAPKRVVQRAANGTDGGRGPRRLSYAEHVFGPKKVTSTTARSIGGSNRW